MFHKNDSSSVPETKLISSAAESKPAQTPILNEFLIPDLEDPILEYIGDENFQSQIRKRKAF